MVESENPQAESGSTVLVPTVPDYPTQLYLEVTNRCNLACKTCPQYWGMPERPADLSVASVRAVVDQLPVLERVVLHGIGESIMNPALPEIVSLVKERGAYTVMNSNGTILRSRRLREVVRAGLDEIRISIDAATSESYQTVRGADALPKIIDNLQFIDEVKREEGMDTPKVSLWMTGLRETVQELPILIRVAAQAGIQEVYLQRLVVSERGLATGEQSLHGSYEEFRPFIEETERVAEQLGITFRGSGDTTGGLSVKGTDDEAPWRACRRPWNLMYLTAHGNVLPCCIAPFTDAPYESLILGNTWEDSLHDIWHGEQYTTWRESMCEGLPPKACSGCGVQWSL
jgi:MoaA/NifB/PqqE/SkfB family radical SAM enzyme